MPDTFEAPITSEFVLKEKMDVDDKNEATMRAADKKREETEM